MYCVVESPKVLNLPIVDLSNIKYMKANRDNMFICIITSNDIMIWFSTVNKLRINFKYVIIIINLFSYLKTSVLVAYYQRADNSVSIHGENHLVEWKNDSSKIVIMVDLNLFFKFKTVC